MPAFERIGRQSISQPCLPHRGVLIPFPSQALSARVGEFDMRGTGRYESGNIARGRIVGV